MAFRLVLAVLVIAVLAGCDQPAAGPGSSDTATSGTVASAPAASGVPAGPLAEIPWEEATALIRRHAVTVVVGAGRRARVVLPAGEERWTRPPTATALRSLADEVDAERSAILWREHPELAWRELLGRVRAGEVDWIIDTDGRRCYVTTGQSERLTIKPALGPVQAQLGAADPRLSGRLLKAPAYEELPWAAAKARLDRKEVSFVHLLHFRRIVLSQAGRPEALSLIPEQVDIEQLVDGMTGIGLAVE